MTYRKCEVVSVNDVENKEWTTKRYIAYKKRQILLTKYKAMKAIKDTNFKMSLELIEITKNLYDFILMRLLNHLLFN